MVAKSSGLKRSKGAADKPVVRDDKGRWVKGGSPVSPGKPPLAAELPMIEGIKAASSAERVAQGLEMLVEIFSDRAMGALVRIRAAELYLSYTVGRPAVKVDLDASIYNQNATTIYLPMLPELESEGGLTDALE